MLCTNIYGKVLFVWILAPFHVPLPLHYSTYISDLTISIIVTETPQASWQLRKGLL